MGHLIHRRHRLGPEERRPGMIPAAHVVLTVRVHEEGPYFVGVVEELDVASFGGTLDEALRMTMDAVCTHLNALDEAGEARQFLAERGIEVHEALPIHEDVAPAQVLARLGEIIARRIVPIGERVPLALG